MLHKKRFRPPVSCCLTCAPTFPTLLTLSNSGVLRLDMIIVHELWYGVAKSQLVAQNSRALSAFLSREIAVLDFSAEDVRAAGEIRASLERRGRRIGEYDTLIAGQSLHRNLILVTANTREYRRVKGLVVEDWSA